MLRPCQLASLATYNYWHCTACLATHALLKHTEAEVNAPLNHTEAEVSAPLKHTEAEVSAPLKHTEAEVNAPLKLRLALR